MFFEDIVETNGDVYDEVDSNPFHFNSAIVDE